MVIWSMMLRDLEKSSSWPNYLNMFGPLSQKWHLRYQMTTWPVTSRDLVMSRSRPSYILIEISLKPLEMEAGVQWTTNREWHIANPIVAWSMTSRDRWRHMTLKNEGHDPDLFEAWHLETHWRCRLDFNGAPVEITPWVSNGHVGYVTLSHKSIRSRSCYSNICVQTSRKTL